MHWTDQFIGKEYIPEVYDCVHLVVEVQNTIYGHDISIPVERESNFIKLSSQIDQHLEHFYEQVETPQEGDMVLMKCRGRLNHTGVYVVLDGVAYVLHNLRNIKSVALHKVRELQKYGMIVDSYYRVKDRETANLAKNAINTKEQEQSTHEEPDYLQSTSDLCGS